MHNQNKTPKDSIRFTGMEKTAKRAWLSRSASEKNVFTSSTRFASAAPKKAVSVVRVAVSNRRANAQKETTSQGPVSSENVINDDFKTFLLGSFIHQHVDDAEELVALLDAVQSMVPDVRRHMRDDLVRWMSNHMPTWTRKLTQDSLVIDANGTCYVQATSTLFDQILPFFSSLNAAMTVDDMVFIQDKSHLRVDMDILKEMVRRISSDYFERCWAQILHEQPSPETVHAYASKCFLKIDKHVDTHKIHVKMRPATPAYPKPAIMREYLKCMLMLSDEDICSTSAH